jgi:hypothetical protein
MILHFSHIGLTEGRTFTLASLFSYELQWFLSPALETGTVAATALRSAAQHKIFALQAHRGMLAGPRFHGSWAPATV